MLHHKEVMLFYNLRSKRLSRLGWYTTGAEEKTEPMKITGFMETVSCPE